MATESVERTRGGHVARLHNQEEYYLLTHVHLDQRAPTFLTAY